MVDEEDMQELYQWIDDIPLSRPKKNINRDFSDGVLTAELVNHFFPKLVDLHNYSAANSVSQKQYNWKTLNQKVFKKMGFSVNADDVQKVCECTTGAIERVLCVVRDRVNQILDNGGKLPHARPAKRPTAAGHEIPASAPVQQKQNQKPAALKSKPAIRAPISQPVPKHRQQALANEGRNAQPRPQPIRKVQQPAADRSPPAVQDVVSSRPTYHIPLMQANPNSARQAIAAQPAPQPQQMNMMTELDRSQRLNDRNLDSGLSEVDVEILVEKETTIQELRETVKILETKVQKMEQLLKLKDQKISKLMGALEAR